MRSCGIHMGRFQIFIVSAQATILYNEFENYANKITAACLRGQGVKLWRTFLQGQISKRKLKLSSRLQYQLETSLHLAASS